MKHLGQREALLDERLGRQARGLQAPVARQLDGRSDGAVDQEQIAAVDEGQPPARRLGALEVRLLEARLIHVHHDPHLGPLADFR